MADQPPPYAGGTRFIGVYLARQLIEAGHDVTLLTRGKKPVTAQIPDDTDESFKAYEAAVKHIACDRTDGGALQEKLSGQGFQGVLLFMTVADKLVTLYISEHSLYWTLLID